MDTIGIRRPVLWALALCCGLLLLNTLQSCGDKDDDEEKLQDVPSNATAIVKFRAQKDRYFKYDTTSPLPKEQRKSFTGLIYYPHDEAYAVIASFEPATTTDTLHMPSSQGDTQTMVKAGVFSFSLGDEKIYHLTGYRHVSGNTKTVVIPFKDKNTGLSCYDAGRYVEVDDPGDESTIDFNLAYNPYCAYNDSFSCLLIPPENVLPVAINAGEKTYHAHKKAAK